MNDWEEEVKNSKELHQLMAALPKMGWNKL